MAPGDNRNIGQVPEEKLGRAEEFFQKIHEAFSGGAAILCVSARIAGPLDIQLVKHSCRRLWERHPLLRARISVKEDGPYFVCDVPFNSIPIHSIFEHGKTDIRTFVEREISSAFDTARCLWKVLLVTDRIKLDKHYLIVCTHRSISDPFCTISLAREMLSGCAGILSGEAAKVSPLPLSPDFERIAASIPESLFSEKDPAPMDTTGRVPFHENAPVGKRYTRIRSHTIEPARLNQLRSLCSSEKATMRGALAATAIMTVQKQLNYSGPIMIKTPCSVRKLSSLEVDESEMRSLTYDACIRSTHPIIDRASFWTFARDYETALLASAPAGDWPAGTHATAQDPGSAAGLPVSCSLMYLDHTGLRKGSPFTVENFLLVTGLRSADQLIFISAMPVEGSLPVTFAYASPLLGEVWVDSFVKSFVQILEKVLK